MMNLQAYVDIIRAFISRGYSVRDFDSHENELSLILRHDIDFSLEYALRMAEAEAEHGFKSTYFIMASSNFYNVASSYSRNLLKTIKDLGHNIGLHFDPTVHDDIDAGFECEKALLEGICGDVKIVSLHRPGAFLDNNNHNIGNVPHTYQDIYFRNMTYMSDSGGAFRYGHPLESEGFRAGRNFHLLIHPIWWVSRANAPSDTIREWQHDTLDFLNREAMANCLTYDGFSILKRED